MKKIIAFDTETYYDKVCTVRKQGAWRYCHDPAFYCYLISVHDGEETWVGEPKDFNWDALEGNDILSHNAFFDRNVYLAGVESNLYPKVNVNSWQCTANMTAALCNRRALGDAVQFLFGEEMSKDPRGNMEGKHWADVKNTPQGFEFLNYAGRDAVESWRIHDRFGAYWSEFERKLSLITLKQCIHGVQIDVQKLDAYLEQSKKVLFGIEMKIPWVAEGEKPSGTKAMAMACRAAGIPTPPVKAHEGEEAHEEWLKRYSAQYPWVAAVSQWRSLNKFIGTLEMIKDRLRPDGTLSFGLKYFGAHTGRWSGDAGINMQNLKKDPLMIDRDGNMRQDEVSLKEYAESFDKDGLPKYTVPWMGRTNWGLVGEDGIPLPSEWEHLYDIRSLFIARPNKKLVCCDLAQIEPRVLAWLAGHEKLLAAIRDGYGVYEAAAVATGKYTGPKGMFKKLKEYAPLYLAQKAQTLALGFGCGPERYGDAAMTLAGYDVSKNDDINPETGKPIKGSAARREVKDWREGNPEIPALWRTLDEQFRACEGSDYIVELPSGRCMTYRNVKKQQKMKARSIINEETGEIIDTKIEPRWVYSAEIDGRRYELYGGLFSENITQATARDVFGYHVIKLDEAGIDVLWTAHDETICEVDVDFDSKLIQTIHSETPPWLEGCPIGAEAKETPCYLK
jgi:hypothetical protein